MKASGPAGSSPPSAKRALTVLVIDDEPAIRLALKRYLARRGIEVDEAADGSAALEMLLGPNARDYGAVICDVRLPGVSGIDVYRRLAAERPELARRLAFATGDATAPDVRELLSQSGCPVVEKPFELENVARTVERLAAR